MILAFCIVLDGMPWVTHHIAAFNRLTVPWRLVFVEGVAKNVNCTKWCREIPPRLSKDGTTEYLRELAKHHPNVHHVPSISWEGKLAMVNHAMADFDSINPHGPSIVMEIDSDELWEASQLATLHRVFETSNRNCAYFKCRYFVGPSIVTTTMDAYGNNPGEWLRCWKWTPGMRFESHEPPKIDGMVERSFSRGETEALGCVFDHYAYCQESQIRFKESYYGYAGAVEQWKRLQQNKQWPVRLKDFLPWVDDLATADLLVKP